MDDFQDRYVSFLKSLEENELDGFIASQPTNLRYLFNLDAELGFAVTSEKETILLIDSRYVEIAQKETVNCKIKLAPVSTLQSLEELASKLFPTNRARIGFESDHLTHSLVSKLKSTISGKQMVPTANVIENLRQVKSANELEAIRKAFEVSSRAYHRIFEDFSWQGSELALAAKLEHKIRMEGAEGIAFKTIVASGSRSSHPHARPSKSLIQDSSLILIDFGAIKNGYHSDTTRVLLRSQDKEEEKILKIVQEAQNRAISGIQAGQKASSIDSLARKYIEDHGYGQYFGHSLGHGLGLEIHELPNVSSTSETVLEVGMVFTVEPGIYLPGRYGVRWEDAVIVTDSGCEVLRIDAPR